MKHNYIRILLASMLLVVVMFLPQISCGQNSIHPEGSGSKEEPFIIRTAENLAWFRDWVNGTYTTDEGEPVTHFDACAKIADEVSEIDMTNVCHGEDSENNIKELCWIPIGNTIYDLSLDEYIDKKWYGTFDGNGKTIRNLYINTKDNYQGLFGVVEAGGIVKHLTIKNAQIISTNYCCGILAGFSNKATFIEIKVDGGSIKGEYEIGGIIGFAIDTKINSCENIASVSGERIVGGICGDLRGNQSIVTNCSNYGEIYGTTAWIGHCFGGIVGNLYLNSVVENCANYANVNGTGYVGGLVGEADKAKLKNLFTFGAVSAESVRGSGNVGLAIGYAHNKTTFEGIIAFNQDATLMYDDQLLEDNLIGYIDEDSQTELVKGYSEEEIASGKVTYLLNNSTSEGALKWYQKLGDDGNQYPMLQSAGDDIVYYGNWCTNEELYTNDNSVFDDNRLAHKRHEMASSPDTQTGLYSYVCPDCNNASQNIKFVKNFCGIAGNNLKLTYDEGKYNAEAVTITDGEAYNSPVDIEVANFKYARTYAAEKWQPLYVPFAMNVDQWTSKGLTVASIENFHEIKQASGDMLVQLEVNEVTSGSLESNTPYLIKQESEGENIIELKNVTLSAASDNLISCCSVTRNYVFNGVYHANRGLEPNSEASINYVVKNGELVLRNDEVPTPQSWFLTVTNRQNIYGEYEPLSSAVKTIPIYMIGDGNPTGIEGIRAITDGTETGGIQQGIYDLQGRKLNQEPESGIYIKDGKKYVK